MTDIKKILIASICVVLAVAIAAGVSIGVLAGTVNGLKDTVAELQQANEAQEALNASMKAELDAAKANGENIVTAEEFETKLAAAIGEQNQTMQALISTAVKNQIEELETEGLTEAQVQEIIDAAVANCLTEADIDAIVAGVDSGLTKDEVKKIVADYTAGTLTYGQIVNLINSADYDLKAFLEAKIEAVADAVEELGGNIEDLEDDLNNKTAKITIDAATFTGTTLNLSDLVSGGTVVLKGDWADKDIVITCDSEKDFVVDLTLITALKTLDIIAPKCHFEVLGAGAIIDDVYATVASDSLVFKGLFIIRTVNVDNGRVVVGEDTTVEIVNIDGSDVKLENKGVIETVIVNEEGATITNDTETNPDATIGSVYVDETIDREEINMDKELEDKITLVWDGESVKEPAYDEETKTYTIVDACELAWIATAGKTFEGETIVLAVNIDLDNKAWTPIGSMTADHGFMGNFDGQGYTIKNLAIVNPTVDEDGYAYAGFFGLTEGTAEKENVVKNLTIENVTISTEGSIVAAVIAYPYYTTVENITVCGDINIKGGHYTAGVLAYTRRCVNATNLTISGNDGSTITGEITVGGVISDIQMNGGLTANYSNFTASNITVSGEKYVGGISGIIFNQTLNGATVTDVTLICEDDARVGIVSGGHGGKYALNDATYENVVGAENIVGAN